jgi:chromate reductase, NAD(P)H dehydrogenase (quinone)
MTRVLAISGSLRRDSYNTALLHAAAEEAPEGVELVFFDGLREIPPFDPDDEGTDAPLAVALLRRAIAEADALLFATPEYNGSVPGVLKNAVDWASRPRATTVMQNKPAAVVGASTGMFGAMWAQQDLKRILGMTGNRVLDVELPVGRAQETFVDGVLAGHHELRVHLRDVLEALEDAVRRRAAIATASLTAD